MSETSEEEEKKQPDFVHYSDSHGSKIEGTSADTALLGGDYADIHQTQDPYELMGMIDEAIFAASENYEEVKAIPGNHEEESGIPVDALYENLTDEEGNFEDGSNSLYEHLTGKEGEDPEDAETLFDLAIAQYDNVEDVSYSSFDIGDYTVVAGGSHQDPELDKKTYDFINEDVDIEKLGYDREELAEEIKNREGLETDEMESRSRKVKEAIKWWFQPVGHEPEPEENEVNPDELTVNDIPEDMRKEAYQKYQQEVEDIKEERSEEIDAMEEKKSALQQLIDDAEKPVIAFDHGIPMTDDAGKDLDYIAREGVETYKGSQVWKEILKENDSIEAFLGGHFHGEMDEKVYGTDLKNPGKGYHKVFMDEELQFERYGFEEINEQLEERPQEQIQMSPQQAQQLQEIQEAVENGDLTQEEGLRKARQILQNEETQQEAAP